METPEVMYCKRYWHSGCRGEIPPMTSGIQLRSSHLRRKDHVLDKGLQEVKTHSNRIKLSPTGPRDFTSNSKDFLEQHSMLFFKIKRCNLDSTIYHLQYLLIAYNLHLHPHKQNLLRHTVSTGQGCC